MAVVQQCYGASNTALNTTLNDNSTVVKSLYFGARDMFKTLYVNQISSQRGSKPTTPDYELASNVFEQTFGTVGQPRVDQMQLCLTMKTFAPNMLPDCVPGNRPHEAILNYILNQNWHSQNVRTNNGVSRNGNGNSSSNSMNGANPLIIMAERNLRLPLLLDLFPNSRSDLWRNHKPCIILSKQHRL